MRIVILSVFLLFLINSKAQEGKIKGRIFDEINNEAIIGADIIIQGTTIGTSSDLEGNFVLDKLTPGNYNLEVSYLGYQTKLIADISVSNSTIINLDIALKETSSTL
jgi:shikimate 5-dehydrogenase